MFTPKNVLTAQDVRDRVNEIRQIRHDDEAAHASEDDLYEIVLVNIRNGTCENSQECAYEALKTKDIEFERWCG